MTTGSRGSTGSHATGGPRAGSGSPGTTRPRANAGSAALLAAAHASFGLIGWTALLVPSLVRVLRTDFHQSDATFGLLYLANALMFAAGALLSGFLSDRFGRRIVVPAGSLIVGIGLLGAAVAPSWPAFMAAVAVSGYGCGTVNASVNGLLLDLGEVGAAARMNRLHLFYSLGALAVPLVVGALVSSGVAWRTLPVGTALVGVALVLPLRLAGGVPPRPRGTPTASSPSDPGGPAAVRAAVPAPPPRRSRRQLRIAIVALSVSIAFYVAAEVGTSSWLVAFLADEPLERATLTLSLLWAGMAVARLFAGRVLERVSPTTVAVVCTTVAGIALIVGVVGPSGLARTAAFGVAGLAFGPVYPTVFSIAGALVPHRGAAMAGALTAASVTGSITYPAIMGMLSGVAGLGVGIVGAGLLMIACGAIVLGTDRVAATG